MSYAFPLIQVPPQIQRLAHIFSQVLHLIDTCPATFTPPPIPDLYPHRRHNKPGLCRIKTPFVMTSLSCSFLSCSKVDKLANASTRSAALINKRGLSIAVDAYSVCTTFRRNVYWAGTGWHFDSDNLVSSPVAKIGGGAAKVM